MSTKATSTAVSNYCMVSCTAWMIFPINMFTVEENWCQLFFISVKLLPLATLNSTNRSSQTKCRQRIEKAFNLIPLFRLNVSTPGKRILLTLFSQTNVVAWVLFVLIEVFPQAECFPWRGTVQSNLNCWISWRSWHGVLLFKVSTLLWWIFDYLSHTWTNKWQRALFCSYDSVYRCVILVRQQMTKVWKND